MIGLGQESLDLQGPQDLDIGIKDRRAGRSAPAEAGSPT